MCMVLMLVCACSSLKTWIPHTSTHTYRYVQYNVAKPVSVFTGESGLGKSTLINSLFLTDLYSKDYPGPSQRIKKTVQVSLFKL